MMELYGHLGHVAKKLGYDDEALEHWNTAAPWSYKYGNEQQIAVVHFNLARVQQEAQQYSLAEKNYASAIKHAEIAIDLVKAAHAQLYLAEVKLIKEKKAQAEELLLSIDEKLLVSSYLLKFNELKSQL
jgi:tetratricopeptide (TPR) repeat protein